MRKLAYRPQGAWRSLKLRIVHGERQSRLACRTTCARLWKRACAQRIIKVGWVNMHVGAQRRACMQPRRSIVCTAPRLCKRTKASAILQTAFLESVIELADTRGTHASASAH